MIGERVGLGLTPSLRLAAAIEEFTSSVPPVVDMLGTGPVEKVIDGVECSALWMLPESDGDHHTRILVSKGGRLYGLAKEEKSNVWVQGPTGKWEIIPDDNPGLDDVRTGLTKTLESLASR